MLEYDVVVLGSGPGGQKAAIAAAKLGKTAAVVERGRVLGGVCVNTGTIPSKTLREAVLYLTGRRGPPAWSSTRNGCWTPTGSSISSRFRRRW